MSSQTQIISEILPDPLPKLTFTEPVKVGSAELDQLISAIAHDAVKRRSSGSEVHPYYAMDLIRQSRLGALQLPVDQGGSGASVRDLFHVVIRLAEADPDLAHILRAHYGFTEQFLRELDPEIRSTWITRVAEGAIIGNAFTELSSRNVGNLSFETTLSPAGDGYRVNNPSLSTLRYD